MKKFTGILSIILILTRTFFFKDTNEKSNITKSYSNVGAAFETVVNSGNLIVNSCECKKIQYHDAQIYFKGGSEVNIEAYSTNYVYHDTDKEILRQYLPNNLKINIRAQYNDTDRNIVWLEAFDFENNEYIGWIDSLYISMEWNDDNHICSYTA